MSLSTIIAEIEAIPSEIRAEAAKFEAALTKDLPEIDKVFAIIAAAAPYLGIIDPELAPESTLIAAGAKAAPAIAANVLADLGSSSTQAAITNTVNTLTSVGQTVTSMTTGGTKATSEKATAVLTNLGTNAVNMLLAAQAAATNSTSSTTATLVQSGPTEEELKG
jgi:hypothetical protein